MKVMDWELTMLIGQYCVMLLDFPLSVSASIVVSFIVSFLMSWTNRPFEIGAVKNLLHELIVLPGLKSMSKLDSMPSSGRNLSCSWLLQKISLFEGARRSFDESGSLSVNKNKKKQNHQSQSIVHYRKKKFKNYKSENVFYKKVTLSVQPTHARYNKNFSMWIIFTI